MDKHTYVCAITFHDIANVGMEIIINCAVCECECEPIFVSSFIYSSYTSALAHTPVSGRTAHDDLLYSSQRARM